MKPGSEQFIFIRKTKMSVEQLVHHEWLVQSKVFLSLVSINEGIGKIPLPADDINHCLTLNPTLTIMNLNNIK